MIYQLSKCSSPGFEFYSETLEHILTVLESNVCGGCKVYNKEFDVGLPDNYDSFSIEEKIHELLSTSCGCAFDVSYYENENEFYDRISDLEFIQF